MEARKQKKEDIDKRIEDLREQRRAKEKARIDKLRAMNLQKYHFDTTPSAVFQSQKLSDKQSRPKNFNSMTNLSRKSLLPRPSMMKHEDENDQAECKTKDIQNTEAPKKLENSSNLTTLGKKEISPKKALNYVPKTLIGVKTAGIKPNCSPSKVGLIKSNVSSQKLPSSTLVGANRKSIVPQNHVNARQTLPPLKLDQPRQSIAQIQVDKPRSAAPLKLEKPRQSIVPIQVEKRKSFAPLKLEKLRESIVPLKGTASTAGSSKVPLKKFMPESISKVAKAANALPAKMSVPVNGTAKKGTTGLAPSTKMSVFERLYKSKSLTDKPEHRKETIYEQKNRLVAAHANSRRSIAPVAVKENVKKIRRSISAVHFKRVGRNELKNCFHRYSSVGEGLNKVDLSQINEDEPLNKPHIVSTVRSERKKTVKFQNATPRADEMEHRLKSWLQKRGKSLDAFQHLRCFGLRRLAPLECPFNDDFDEEDKENIAVSDDGSFTDLINDREHDFEEAKTKWRRASCFNDSEVLSECTEVDKSPVSTETPMPKPRVDELLLGALNDLSQLVRDGYDWEQCARWLRAIRNRSPHAVDLAAYWECRAALEECRGNLPRSCLCWEEAIAKGTETSVVEASLDQLLDKFMQLNISPGQERPTLTKEMLCAKDVFRTSLIRFAVQNAKAKNESAVYTVTPVRRSVRLSGVTPASIKRRPTTGEKRTPLIQLASSLRMIDEDIRDKSIFIPNKLLQYSP